MPWRRTSVPTSQADEGCGILDRKGGRRHLSLKVKSGTRLVPAVLQILALLFLVAAVVKFDRAHLVGLLHRLENSQPFTLSRPLGQFTHGSECRCLNQFFGAQTARF
jgi:hypothetical protein